MVDKANGVLLDTDVEEGKVALRVDDDQVLSEAQSGAVSVGDLGVGDDEGDLHLHHPVYIIGVAAGWSQRWNWNTVLGT